MRILGVTLVITNPHKPPIGQRIKALPQKVKSTLPNFGRALVGVVPIIGSVAAGVGLYYGLPDVREIVDHGREYLRELTPLPQLITSALTIGLAADFLAQRYQGVKINLRRLAAMTLFGAVNGGIIATLFYHYQENVFFPEGTPFRTIKQVAFDQAGYTPLYLIYYFSGVNFLLHRIPWSAYFRQGMISKDNLNNHKNIATDRVKPLWDALRTQGIINIQNEKGIITSKFKFWANLELGVELNDDEHKALIDVLSSAPNLRSSVVKTLPVNWFYWGLIACPTFYSVAEDLQVMTMNIFAVIWFSFMSKMAHDQIKQAKA